jgi:hypothetical protein
MKIVLYLLCPDEETLEITKSKYKEINWLYPICMPKLNTVLPIFENAVYKILLELKNQWEFADFVGTLSWNFESKVKLLGIESTLKCKSQYDFVPFWVIRDRSAVNSGISNHGDNFGTAWSYLKYRNRFINIIMNKEVVECGSNYWMCRPYLMVEFIEWHRKNLMFANENFELFSSEAFYPAGNMNGTKMIQIWGKPFYPLLPFVFERFNIMFFANHSNCILENSLIVSEGNCRELCNSTIQKHTLFCIGERNEDFIDIKHNALPFIHHSSNINFTCSKENEEMQMIRKTLISYTQSNQSNTGNDENLFFLFTSPIRVICVWKRMLMTLNSPITPYSDLYYLGFCPLTDNGTHWNYNNLHVFPTSPLDESCKLNKVVYGGGIAFRKSMMEELLNSTENGSLSDYLWKRKKVSIGIFPQFVVPHVTGTNEYCKNVMLKFCNPKFTSYQFYNKSLCWNGWLPS